MSPDPSSTAAPAPSLTDGDVATAAASVSSLADRLALPAALAPYADLRWTTSAEARPTLHIDDVSGIPFLDGIAGVELYQHRARVRAGSGDMVAAVSPMPPGYEDYCRRDLGLGDPELILAEPAAGPIEVARACSQGDAFRRLARRAAHEGALAIHPYMGIEAVWDLAAGLRRETGVPISVLAPPPPVNWIANDKALLSEVVASVLGAGWLVETVVATEPRALARALGDLSSRHARVGMKRTRCASAMGNVVHDGAELRGRRPEELLAVVQEFLARTRWPEGEAVLCVAWETTDLSPSTQIWIPPAGSGPPRLDGVYEQILEGPEKVFVGSRPSRLPARLNQRIGLASLKVAAALQHLGYVGRCSFDLLVIGDPEGECELRFTECNGRWGGTSTPMHLLDRIVDRATTGRRPPYRAQDYVHPGLVGVSFVDLLDRVGERLLRPGAAGGDGMFVFYNVGPLERRGKLDVIAIGDTQQAAEEAVERGLPALLGHRGD